MLLVFLVALLISVALVPLLIRHAQRFGFIDAPNQRKVHNSPIPRIGGIAMVIGAVTPAVVWLDVDTQLLAFLLGVSIIFVFGMWDDCRDLDYRLKFSGQILAAILVTIFGDVVIRQIPFGPDAGLPDSVAIPLTIIFLVGTTNAVNLADGLDGLASGVSLLSTGAIALLAYLAGGEALLVLALAVSGAICGFLRYNTHPAIVFMGDTGSQFLGFSLGFMVVVLTQDVSQAVSPVLLVLILGLPILDTLSVMLVRVREGRSPFSPDRNHLHHKLLASGLRHYEAVGAIYVLQGLFVGTALFLRYHSDLMLSAIYMAACLAVVVFIFLVRLLRHDNSRPERESRLGRYLRSIKSHTVVREGPLMFLTVALPLFLLGGAVAPAVVPKDFGIYAAITFMLLAARLYFGFVAWFLFLRLLVFVALAFVAYLCEVSPRSVDNMLVNTDIAYIYFGALSLAIVLVVRYRLVDVFNITPVDVLVIMALLSIGAIPDDIREEYLLVPIIIKIVVLFYAAELVLKSMKSRWSILPLSSLAALGILAVRGLLSF